jgi:hypothetical protein
LYDRIETQTSSENSIYARERARKAFATKPANAGVKLSQGAMKAVSLIGDRVQR